MASTMLGDSNGTSVGSLYTRVMVDLRDPRSDGWLLMDSIWPTIALSASYYLIVRYIGPRLMKNREPFNLKYVMLAYNLFQTVFNSWIFYKVFWLWRDHYSWTCQPVDYSQSLHGLAALDVTWWYFFSKFIDFFDSFFFVARKKFSHLSSLHVVHHGGLPIAVWFGPKFVGGGHTTFCGFLNSGVHVAMYLYYFLAALGPSIQPYLWWKRYLTRLQMAQFVIFFAHAMQPLFIECDYPKIYCWIILGHGVLYFCLFSNFYSKSYLSKKSKSEPVKAKTDEKEEGAVGKTNGVSENKENMVNKEEESWEVLSSETNGMSKKTQ